MYSVFLLRQQLSWTKCPRRPEIESNGLSFCSCKSSPKYSVFVHGTWAQRSRFSFSLITQIQTRLTDHSNTLKPKHRSLVSHSSNPHSYSSNLAPLRVLTVSHSHSSNLAPTAQPHHSSNPHFHSPSNLVPCHCSTSSLFKLSLSLFKPRATAQPQSEGRYPFSICLLWLDLNNIFI